MKPATFTVDGKTTWGAVTDDGVPDLAPLFPDWPDLKSVIEAAGLDAVLNAARERTPDHAVRDVTFEIPIQNPEKIICVGVNFPGRNAEYKDGSDAPQYMSLFPRFARSFTGHNRPLIRPKASSQLDYEGEIAIVIGKGGRHIPKEKAYDHIAAITICNEGTLRDWVRHAKFNVTQGKNFDCSGAIGPWLVPFTDPAQLDDVRIQTRVNGETRQDDRTGRMIFSIKDEIAYISTFTTLVPGDVIITGTPMGAGARMDPPQFLKPGDVVEVEVEGIGTLRNTVEDET